MSSNFSVLSFDTLNVTTRFGLSPCRETAEPTAGLASDAHPCVEFRITKKPSLRRGFLFQSTERLDRFQFRFYRLGLLHDRRRLGRLAGRRDALGHGLRLLVSFRLFRLGLPVRSFVAHGDSPFTRDAVENHRADFIVDPADPRRRKFLHCSAPINCPSDKSQPVRRSPAHGRP
jgi:hypothetical protein